MMTVVKWLIFLGLGLILTGILLWFCQKMGLNLGKLPGDIVIKREKWGLYAPIATSLIVSIILTILINFIFWWIRK